MSYFGNGSSLPPQSNTTILPFDFAYFAANKLSYVGTYFCKRRYFPTSIAFIY